MATDAVFSVIAEGTRRLILETLRDGDRAVGELVEELGVSQPTVSKHLKVLREAGLVTTRAQGQKRYYSLDAAPLDHINSWLAPFETGNSPRRDPAGGPDTAGGDTGLVGATGAIGVTGVTGSAASASLPPAAEPVHEDQGTTADPASAGGADATAVDLMEAAPVPDALAVAVSAGSGLPTGVEVTRPIGRTMGRAAERAADILSQLRRRRDPSA